MKLTAAKIAEIVNGKVEGNSAVEVSQVAKIEDAKADNLCFISNKKYIHYLQTTEAGIVLVGDNINPIPEGKTVIRCSHPYVAFCQILIQFFDYKNPQQGIHSTATIEPSASIGKNCHIGPHTYIGENVTIGDNTRIFANCSIYEDTKIGANTLIYSNVSIYYQSQIGDNCIIHSGTAIGSDGFGHAPMPDGTYIKIPQIGNVVIGNNVEIGSNSSIDRANMGSTIIGDGCRIDNLVQIAHGVVIGQNTVLAGQVAIAGSTTIGDNCVIAGQVGIVGHISIANNTQIGAQSGVNHTIKEEGGKFTDSPHLPMGNALKSRVLYRNLPEMEKRIRELESKLKTENKSENG
ncbi:MAG: UDP-3-O-(3-hydroxymyristoyl)glucosamine N-acyltransferase [Bacteroidia bacterium]|nr:UDP-3-O-(3-hydroxymyristoyl)glucosamine N-acyltransferase [Bacteroidia bacterium]NNJ55057.1 UDP-3-O-(3-hydroxymyristoyl)glucosamine N-acyltransferase [Bacteroidia bacterium]